MFYILYFPTQSSRFTLASVGLETSCLTINFRFVTFLAHIWWAVTNVRGVAGRKAVGSIFKWRMNDWKFTSQKSSSWLSGNMWCWFLKLFKSTFWHVSARDTRKEFSFRKQKTINKSEIKIIASDMLCKSFPLLRWNCFSFSAAERCGDESLFRSRSTLSLAWSLLPKLPTFDFKDYGAEFGIV